MVSIDVGVWTTSSNTMYQVEATLPVESIQPGTNVLVTGPPMTGKYDLMVDVLADGCRMGDGALFITTQNSAERVERDVADALNDDPTNLGIVDCVSQERGVETPPHPRIKYASSPGDLTGIGMAASDLLGRFSQHGSRTRAGLYSISQLLMYADVQTVFRFLHVLTGRMNAADALGFFTLDAESHDKQTVQTIQQLFDGLVETRDHQGRRQYRVRNLGATTTDWQEF